MLAVGHHPDEVELVAAAQDVFGIEADWLLVLTWIRAMKSPRRVVTISTLLGMMSGLNTQIYVWTGVVLVREPGPRVAAWLGTVADLLQESLVEMPHEVIFEQLQRTFDVTAVSLTWASESSGYGVIVRPHDALEPLSESGSMEAWLRGEVQGCHPLVAWHLATGDPRPWTNGRVPTALVPARKRIRVESLLRPLQLEQQLSISYRLEGPSYCTYVLGRGGLDFDDEDLVVAQHVQRALVGLHRQIVLLNGLLSISTSSRSDAGLTARERAVLSLLAAGHSTRVAAHELGCSPRTIDKHLEHAYRKLGVSDKLNAIRTLQACGGLPLGYVTTKDPPPPRRRAFSTSPTLTPTR